MSSEAASETLSVGSVVRPDSPVILRGDRVAMIRARLEQCAVWADAAEDERDCAVWDEAAMAEPGAGAVRVGAPASHLAPAPARGIDRVDRVERVEVARQSAFEGLRKSLWEGCGRKQDAGRPMAFARGASFRRGRSSCYRSARISGSFAPVRSSFPSCEFDDLNEGLGATRVVEEPIV